MFGFLIEEVRYIVEGSGTRSRKDRKFKAIWKASKHQGDTHDLTPDPKRKAIARSNLQRKQGADILKRKAADKSRYDQEKKAADPKRAKHGIPPRPSYHRGDTTQRGRQHIAQMRGKHYDSVFGIHKSEPRPEPRKKGAKFEARGKEKRRRQRLGGNDPKNRHPKVPKHRDDPMGFYPQKGRMVKSFGKKANAKHPDDEKLTKADFAADLKSFRSRPKLPR